MEAAVPPKPSGSGGAKVISEGASKSPSQDSAAAIEGSTNPKSNSKPKKAA